MKNMKRRFSILIFVLGLGSLIAGCGNTQGGPEGYEPELELKSYVVPSEYVSELSTAIDLLLRRGIGPEAKNLGNARIGPGGLLLVAAPSSIHDGIVKMLADLESSQPELPPTVILTYWIVIGKPAQETTWPSRLDGISSALEAVSDTDGPMKFLLLEQLRMQSLSGEHAELSGRKIKVDQRATVRDENVLAQIGISPSNTRIPFSTIVRMQTGKLLVLGQSGASGIFGRDLSEKRGMEVDPEDSVIYIVRAEKAG